MKKIIKKIMYKCDSALLYVASVLLMIATILSVFNAILRYVGHGGFAWSDEACVIFMILMVFLAQPFLEGESKQLSIGILSSRLKTERSKKIMQVVRGILMIVIVGLMIPYCIQVVEKAAKFNYMTSVLRLPRYLLYACLLVSFILIVINWIVNIFFKKPNEEYQPEAEQIAESGVEEQ